MKEVMLIDLDNTACDFAKAHKAAIKKEPGIIYPQSQYKFFENLEPMDGFIQAYFLLREDYEIAFLSRPSVCNKLSFTEKAVWVERHLGARALKSLILCCDKTRVKGDYLIDDFDQNGLYEPEWKHIKFGSKEFPNWNVVLNYFMFKK